MNIKASFIQSWLCMSFSSQRWDDEFIQMKSVGIDTLILADIFGQNKSGIWQGCFNYSDDDISFNNNINDMLEATFKAAKRNNMKLILGTGSYDKWWSFRPHGKNIINFYKKSCDIIEYIYNKYCVEYADNFYGWYFIPEISNSLTLKANKNVVKAMNILIGKINVLSPNHPLMLSPYYTNFVGCSLKSMEKHWIRILKNVNFRPFDILCPQDAIGSGWIEFKDFDNVMRMYQNAIKASNKDIQFWINCENFCQPHKGVPLFPKKTTYNNFIPAPINRFAQQIDYSKKYTDTIITFAFNHYYSKNSVSKEFYKSLLKYINGIPQEKTGLNILNLSYFYDDKNHTITIKINNDIPFVSCTIYCNGKFILRKDCDLECGAILQKSFTLKRKGKFFIECEDAFGNIYSGKIC